MSLFGPFVDKIGPTISAALCNLLDGIQNGLVTFSTFTVTATGFSGTPPTALASFRRFGNVGSLILGGPGITGTSNATTFTITGLSAPATPATIPNQLIACFFTDNGIVKPGQVNFQAGSNIMTCFLPGGFTASGTKAFPPQPVFYLLD